MLNEGYASFFYTLLVKAWQANTQLEYMVTNSEQQSLGPSQDSNPGCPDRMKALYQCQKVKQNFSTAVHQKLSPDAQSTARRNQTWKSQSQENPTCVQFYCFSLKTLSKAALSLVYVKKQSLSILSLSLSFSQTLSLSLSRSLTPSLSLILPLYSELQPNQNQPRVIGL